MKNTFFMIFALLATISFLSCKKLIQVDLPKNQQNTSDVFSDSLSTNAALLNIYALIDKTVDNNLNKYTGLFTDELNPTVVTDEFWTNNLTPANNTVLNFWKNSYFAIYSCNEIINRLSGESVLPLGYRKNAVAEAKFLRAYLYFYLVNSFGDVPLILTTEVSTNISMARNGADEVYAQIIRDLKSAENDASILSYTGRTRAGKWAAKALLARVYLYQKNWAEASANAESVIASGLFTPLPILSNVFLTNSRETILQIWTPNGFIADGAVLIPSTGRPTYSITAGLLNNFESGDQRKSVWTRGVVVGNITYNYSYKYKNRVVNTSAPEYLVSLRLAEQYLIRAESQANLGNISSAIKDLNIIRARAGLSALNENFTKENCLNAVNKEWRNEFFMEWGHRFYELKRAGKLQEALLGVKANWTEKSIYFPIPLTEITANQNLTQNNGY